MLYYKALRTEPQIAPSAVVSDTEFGVYCEVYERTKISESRIGDYSYVVNDCNIIYTDMAKFCSIAAHVRINPGQHPLGHAALHHFTYRSRQFGMGDDDADFFDGRRSKRVTIGNDVWVGHGSVIMPDITIGTGAAIGAGSIVTHDVPDFTVVAGCPARPIRERFDRDTQEKLLEIAWWDWSHEEIKNALPDFRSLRAEEFVEKYLPVREMRKCQ